MGEFDGKVALVTGAASGIGLAAARLLGERGARVVMVDRAADTLEAVAKEVPGDPVLNVTDVADPQQVAAGYAAAAEEAGPVDLVFNNAGIVIGGRPLHEISLEEFDRVVQVNLYGAYYVLAEGIRAMLAHGRGGSIVNTASIGGLRGFVGSGSYGASKHGVIGLTRTAAIEVATQGIRVNAVAPGRVETGIVSSSAQSETIIANRATAAQPAMGRMGAPEEIAEVVLWLLSDAASFVTGSVYVADGGQTAA